MGRNLIHINFLGQIIKGQSLWQRHCGNLGAATALIPASQKLQAFKAHWRLHTKTYLVKVHQGQKPKTESVEKSNWIKVLTEMHSNETF